MPTTKKDSNSKDPYAIVTDAIIAHLEKGVVPWHKPFNVEVGMPRSIDGRYYRGINIMLLGLQPFSDPRWGTFKALSAKGGSVRKGEKGTFVVFFKMLQSKTEVDAKGQPKKIPLLRYFYVFNAEQCEWTEPLPTIDTGGNHHDDEDWEDAAAEVFANYPGAPDMNHGSVGASYSPALDLVSMPDRENFDSPASYYWIQYHELIHSTGHEDRLNREIKNSFGSDPYAREELCAEMGAAFIGTIVGVPERIAASASYIDNWLQKLRGDTRLVVSAASRAQRAVDYILQQNQDYIETESR